MTLPPPEGTPVRSRWGTIMAESFACSRGARRSAWAPPEWNSLTLQQIHLVLREKRTVEFWEALRRKKEKARGRGSGGQDGAIDKQRPVASRAARGRVKGQVAVKSQPSPPLYPFEWPTSSADLHKLPTDINCYPFGLLPDPPPGKTHGWCQAKLVAMAGDAAAKNAEEAAARKSRLAEWSQEKRIDREGRAVPGGVSVGGVSASNDTFISEEEKADELAREQDRKTEAAENERQARQEARNEARRKALAKKARESWLKYIPDIHKVAMQSKVGGASARAVSTESLAGGAKGTKAKDSATNAPSSGPSSGGGVASSLSTFFFPETKAEVAAPTHGSIEGGAGTAAAPLVVPAPTMRAVPAETHDDWEGEEDGARTSQLPKGDHTTRAAVLPEKREASAVTGP